MSALVTATRASVDGPPRLAVVYDAIRRAVVLNEIAAGSALTEMALAAEHRCSQGTVREALMRLQEEGLVVRAGYRGTMVSGLDAEEARVMLEVRKQIEREGARRLPARAVSPLLDSLEAELGAMRRAADAGDVYALICHDTAFHQALFASAGLPALEPILRRASIHTHRFKLWAPEHQRPLPATAERHRPLIDAVRRGDKKALERELVRHLDTIVEPWPDRPRGGAPTHSPSTNSPSKEKTR
jgi:DNA-binding GntR family transcriptional regulator